MSLKRKLIAAGLPAAGATIFALALAGPASAAPAELLAGPAALPAQAMVDCEGAVAKLTAACAGADDDGTPTRGNAGYGYGDGDAPGDSGGGTGDGDEGPVRGNDGYGGVDNAPSPTVPTPSPTTGTPGGGGVRPGELPIPGEGDGVSPGELPIPGEGGGAGPDELPVTGAPLGLLAALGGGLVAAGLAARFAVRRRKA